MGAPVRVDCLVCTWYGGWVEQMQPSWASRLEGQAEATQPEPTAGSVLGEEGEWVVVEEEDREEDLPPVLHKAWEAHKIPAQGQEITRGLSISIIMCSCSRAEAVWVCFVLWAY